MQTAAALALSALLVATAKGQLFQDGTSHVPGVERQLPTFMRSKLGPGDRIHPGDFLIAKSGRVLLNMLEMGNVVVYNIDKSKTEWQTELQEEYDQASFHMRKDGNLVLEDEDGEVMWQSHTSGNPGAILHLRDDADLVVTKDDEILWSSKEDKKKNKKKKKKVEL